MRTRRVLQVPVIAQATDHECGNTCLASVVQFHGKRYSPAELAVLARTTEHGTDHRGMIDAAIATGATVLARAGGSCDLLASVVARGLPVIVGWWSMEPGDAHHDPRWSLEERRARDRGHYSVVCGVTPEGFVLMDPDGGRCVEISEHRFERVWYDTDTDAYELVRGWYLVIDYETAAIEVGTAARS